MIDETIALLGRVASDKVTGFRGVITSASFDLYGCVQVALTPPAPADGQELKHGHWFDVNRVQVSADRVMPVPDFDAKGDQPENYTHGAAIKPAMGA